MWLDAFLCQDDLAVDCANDAVSRRTDITVLDVRLIIFGAEIDQIRKELNEINFAKLLLRVISPIRFFENGVAVKPRNVAYILRHGFNCNIEESLFLPEHRTARDLYQNVGVVAGELKVAIKRKLHGYERDCEIGSKYFVV